MTNSLSSIKSIVKTPKPATQPDKENLLYKSLLANIDRHLKSSTNAFSPPEVMKSRENSQENLR